MQLLHLLQSNWTTTKWLVHVRRLKKLEEHHRIQQRISTSNSAGLHMCLHKCGAKGTPLFPLQCRMKILLLQGTLFPQLYPRHLEDHVKICKEGRKKQILSSDTRFLRHRFTFLCDIGPPWNWHKTLEWTFAGINDHYKSHYVLPK